MFGRTSSPQTGYTAMFSNEADAAQVAGTATATATATAAATPVQDRSDSERPPERMSRVAFHHQVMACVRKLQAWQPQRGALQDVYKVALEGHKHALSAQPLSQEWHDFAVELKEGVATYEQDWARLVGLNQGMIHEFDWTQTELLEDPFDVLLQRQLAVAHGKFKEAKTAFCEGDAHTALRLDHQGRQYCWFARAILRCVREGTAADKQSLHQMLAEGMQRGTTQKMYQQLKTSRWYEQAPLVEALTDDPFAEMSSPPKPRRTAAAISASTSPSTSASTWSPPCTPTGTLTRTSINRTDSERTVHQRLQDLADLARLRFEQIDPTKQLGRTLQLLRLEMPRRGEVPSTVYLAALDELERDVAVAQRVCHRQQDALLAKQNWLEFLKTRPDMAEMLHYRTLGASNAYHASVLALQQGQLDLAEQSARECFDLATMSLQMAQAAEKGHWPEAAAQIERRDALSREAYAVAAPPVTITVSRLLERVLALRNRFDTAVDQAQADKLLGLMARTLDHAKALKRTTPHVWNAATPALKRPASPPDAAAPAPFRPAPAGSNAHGCHPAAAPPAR